MELRDYQAANEYEILSAWQAGYRDLLYVLPCGGGKTRVSANIITKFETPVGVVAHRRELVSQLSGALSDLNVTHDVIASKKTIRQIQEKQFKVHRRSFYDPSSSIKVGSIRTFLTQKKKLARWAGNVGLWVQDEAHHVTRDNQWGEGRSLFPNAVGLGLTATPMRSDGKGLGRHASGVFDKMIMGPGMRDLIERGYLTDYRFVTPVTDVLLEDSDVSLSTGEYKKEAVKNAIKRSHVIGDVVTNYRKFAAGKLAVCFADSLENGQAIAQRFNSEGIRAELVSGETDEGLRYHILTRFENREIDVVVNVDLFGEGTDIPAVECVIMARPTMSRGLYIQQFGRALRLLPGKDYGIIIDHVENWKRHNLPDADRIWTLDDAPRGSRRKPDPDLIPLTRCTNPECFEAYEAYRISCPHCGHKPEPVNRSSIKHVDGDLVELDPEVLKQMRAEVHKIDLDPNDIFRAVRNGGKPVALANIITKNHVLRQGAQKELRKAIAVWGAIQREKGLVDRESYKLFYLKFGIDVTSAQALNTKDADVLNGRVIDDCHKSMGAKMESTAAGVD